jgi:hypothetical protein
MTQENFGIIVGCDARQEWMLKTFFINLRLHSDLPFVVFDFGMSHLGKKMAEKWAQVISLETNLRKFKYQKFNSRKEVWLKKPQAFENAPFDFNLWLDLDCLVRSDPKEIFDYLQPDKEIVIRQEKKLPKNKVNNFLIQKYPFFKMYNSGVVAFRKMASFIEPWIDIIQTTQDLFRGDQDLLSIYLSQNENIIENLPVQFNHMIDIDKQIVIDQAKIIHFINSSKGYLSLQDKMLFEMVYGNEEFKNKPFLLPLTWKQKRRLLSV